MHQRGQKIERGCEREREREREREGARERGRERARERERERESEREERESGGTAETIWQSGLNFKSGGNPPDKNMDVRVQSGSTTNLAIPWAIHILADFSIWQDCKSGHIPNPG